MAFDGLLSISATDKGACREYSLEHGSLKNLHSSLPKKKKEKENERFYCTSILKNCHHKHSFGVST